MNDETKLEATKCSCGAITIYGEGFTNSMRPSVFKKHFTGRAFRFRWLQKTCCCDHCVNHYGIDLCGCGSGEKVGKCDEEFDQCKNKIPMQILFGAMHSLEEVIINREGF